MTPIKYISCQYSEMFQCFCLHFAGWQWQCSGSQWSVVSSVFLPLFENKDNVGSHLLEPCSRFLPILVIFDSFGWAPGLLQQSVFSLHLSLLLSLEPLSFEPLTLRCPVLLCLATGSSPGPVHLTNDYFFLHHSLVLHMFPGLRKF